DEAIGLGCAARERRPCPPPISPARCPLQPPLAPAGRASPSDRSSTGRQRLAPSPIETGPSQIEIDDGARRLTPGLYKLQIDAGPPPSAPDRRPPLQHDAGPPSAPDRRPSIAAGRPSTPDRRRLHICCAGQRCNNPEKGTKCNHVRFKKQGPKYLEDLHILFEKVHVTGASASCPGDVSSTESSDEDVTEVQKSPDSDDVKLAALKKAKPSKKKRKDMSSGTEDKEEKSPFLRLYKNTCLKIENAATKISTSAEASSAAPPNLVPTITEAIQMVKECGVEEKTALMHTATKLIMKPEFREVLRALKTNEGRLDLIEREHKMSTPCMSSNESLTGAAGREATSVAVAPGGDAAASGDLAPGGRAAG
ncbi:hypothetical protein EJB05_05140, partial [Eragrostis curvula]